MPAQPHRIDRAVENHFDRLRLARPAIKQRVLRHWGVSRILSGYWHTQYATGEIYAVCSARPLPVRRAPGTLRAEWPDWLTDRMKSEMRGAFPERKREPLNTP